MQLWSQAIDDSCYVGSVFFDLQKAFDRVWHKGLLAKLHAFGVRDSLYRWFESYLSGRKQCTRIDHSVSSWASLHAGVPQGAILSPLLFILYVNDITSACSSNVNLFGDDTSTFVTHSDPSRLLTRLQVAVDSLSAWFDRWLLSVNPAKSAVMIIRSRGMPPVHAQISLKQEQIQQVSTHKHLGLTITDSLTWDAHVQCIIAKASKRLGMLQRYKNRLAALAIGHYYCSAIRPVELSLCPGQQVVGAVPAPSGASHHWGKAS